MAFYGDFRAYKQFTIFLSSASGASFCPVHDRLLAAAEKSDGGIGGKGGDGVAVQGREYEGQRRLDVATRSVSAPDRLYGGGEGAEDSVRKSTAWHCASPSLGGGASASRAAGPGLASRGRASHNCRPATEEGVSVRPRSVPGRALCGQLAPCSSALASGPTCRVDSARKIDPARRGNLEGSLLFSRSRSASSS